MHILDIVVTAFTWKLLRLCAALGIDYNTPGTPRLIFNTSSTSGTQQCVNFNITDDTIVEGQQMIVVQFDTGSEAPLGQIDFNPSASMITVVDNDGNVYVVETRTHNFCAWLCVGGRRQKK